MSRIEKPRRKAAPKVIKEVEGVSSEDENEASAPENEEELMNDSGSDSMVEEPLGGSAAGSEVS